MKTFLVMMAIALTTCFTGRYYLISPTEEKKETTGEQSTSGDESAILISYDAILPIFQFYIPVAPVLFFVIKTSDSAEIPVFIPEGPRFEVIRKIVFSRIVCPNAP